MIHFVSGCFISNCCCLSEENIPWFSYLYFEEEKQLTMILTALGDTGLPLFENAEIC